MGITTANEWWGPAQEFPFLLGNNAAGFPHIFVGTERPVNVLIGHLHARVLYGKLDQSSFSPVTGSKYYSSNIEGGRVRFASGLLTVLEPTGLTGLELGVGRFFHSPWPSSGIPRSYVSTPLRAVFRSGVSSSAVETNQLASAFARWAFPKSGFEFYGEYGKEDHNYDFRDFVQEPDHARAYLIGARKVVHLQTDRFDALRFEAINFQTPGLVRLGRGEGSIYVHSLIRQGHTNRGQLLGADVGVGSAAAASVGWDQFSRNGRSSITWNRVVTQESGTFNDNGIASPNSEDVAHSLSIERVAFLRGIDLTLGTTIARDFNRNFRQDAWNLNALLQARYRFR